jgi:hypothetical protein
MAGDERAVRAARNEALFRAVNDEMRELNEGLAAITDEYAIVCECADGGCTESLLIRRLDYYAVRENPRRFIVLRDHVVGDVEQVVSGLDGYVVVEKIGLAAAVAEEAEPAQD